jgi:hypothetical protein
MDQPRAETVVFRVLNPEDELLILEYRLHHAEQELDLFLFNLNQGAFTDVPDHEIDATLDMFDRTITGIKHELDRYARRLKARRGRDPSNIRRYHAERI